MSKSQAIIFDWGGVLIDNPAQGLIDYCAKTLKAPLNRYREAQSRVIHDFEKGLIEEDFFWKNICKTLNTDLPTQKSLWGDAFRAVYREKTEVFELARNLKTNGYAVGFLSNTEAAAMQYFHEKGYDFFDATVFSCAEKMAKPDVRIYKLAAERIGLAPADCVFIDDKPHYAAGARAAGMQAIVFQSPAQIINELKQLGLSI